MTADEVIQDDFDDGVLDPAWQIELRDALGWTYEEAGTDLTVTEIDPAVINPAGGGTWAVVSLSRTFSAMDDFQVDFDFSWDCEGSNAAMQRVSVSLLDAGGETVVAAGLSDPWRASPPGQFALIGATSQNEPDQLPFAGTATVDLDRTADQVTISWDGSPIMTDVLSTPVAGVEIIFAFYAYQEPIVSFFGTESVDWVSVEGTPTAVQATTWGSAKARFR